MKVKIIVFIVQKKHGSMKSFDEAVEGMAEYMSESEKIDKNFARKKVLEYMKSMPALERKFLKSNLTKVNFFYYT